MPGWPWLRTAEATRFLDNMSAEYDRVDRDLARTHVPCPVCEKTAHLEDVGPEGLLLFVCPAGHRFIVAPEAER